MLTAIRKKQFESWSENALLHQMRDESYTFEEHQYMAIVLSQRRNGVPPTKSPGIVAIRKDQEPKCNEKRVKLAEKRYLFRLAGYTACNGGKPLKGELVLYKGRECKITCAFYRKAVNQVCAHLSDPITGKSLHQGINIKLLTFYRDVSREVAWYVNNSYIDNK